MLGLRQQIRRDPAGLAALRKDHRFRGPSMQIDRAIRAHELLRRGHVTIPRPEYFIHSRKVARPVSQCGNPLSPADPRDRLHPKKISRCKQFGARLGANNHDAPHPSHLRRHHGHQQSRDQRKSPAGNVAPDRFNRSHDLADPHAALNIKRPSHRHLFFSHAPDIPRRLAHSAHEASVHDASSSAKIAPPNPHRPAANISAIKPQGPLDKRPIPPPPHIRNNPRRHTLSRAIPLAASQQQLLHHPAIKPKDPHHSTILFKGYSTIPCALAAFNLGKICRTTASSTIVFTATHPGSLKVEIVGFCSAGNTFSTALKSSRRTFSINPTLLEARIAPCSINTIFSAFSFFQASAAAARFIMNTVADSSTVSTILNRCARSEAPVSVTSTIASASCGTFTSVAPQEKSTRARTSCRAKNPSVIFTISVAITFPAKSPTERIAESSGTASTQRTRAILCLA